MDLGIEFPNDLRSELVDEALKARAPSLLCSAPGESLDTAKELSSKFDAKEDAEITQAVMLPENVDTRVKYRGRFL